MSAHIYAGLISQSIDIFIQDASSTVGAGLSGLVYNSGSLVASYRKGATGSRTAITLATQTVGGAYSSGGFVEIDATHMKGAYRLDLPNAAVDTEGFITVYLYGAANMVPVVLRIDCKAVPANMLQINNAATGAANLALSAAAIVICTADTGASTTSIPTSACSPAGSAADQFKGRIIIFRSDTATAALKGQATVITASSNSATPAFTVDALTTAPSSGDVFVIV
jgi:hypothetical protein